MCSCARSTSVRMSPMPRIRCASRSGWKTSIASSFSPVPMSLTGTPVTARTESDDLIDRGGAVHVRRDEERMPTLFAQQVRQLRGGRGLSRSLKPCEDDDRRWPVRARERCRGAPEHLHDGVVDDLHDLLRAGYRFEDALAGRALAHGRDELSHDLEVHVGLEEGDTHVAQRLIQID